MRRVDRGPHPLDDANRPKRFHPYNKAKSDLLERIGEYCSYCERTTDLHVEHVVPRCRRPELAEEWTNFLLACSKKLEDGADVVGCVIRLAVAIGFWSVWITVFAGHPQVRDLLRQHFPGSR